MLKWAFQGMNSGFNSLSLSRIIGADYLQFYQISPHLKEIAFTFV